MHDQKARVRYIYSTKEVNLYGSLTIAGKRIKGKQIDHSNIIIDKYDET